MKHSDFSPEALEFLLELAPTMIWWKTPQESLEFPQQLVAAIMDLGSLGDTRKLRNLVSDEVLRDVLAQAEPGQFRPQSWTYWQLVLNGLVDTQVPVQPTRSFR